MRPGSNSNVKEAGEPDGGEAVEARDPEVVAKTERQRFTVEDKLRVLKAADACTKQGELGALLRREGIYRSTLKDWRRRYARGGVEALKPKKPGMKPKTNRLEAENELLRRELGQAQQRLARAEIIIEVQKKVSKILEDQAQTKEGKETLS